MSGAMRQLAFVLASSLLLSCGDTGREQVEIPLYVRGTRARVLPVSGGSLTLLEAQVALGPLYLCATESAESALCETALAELLSVLSVDALSEEPVAAGELLGTTGTVRSAFFDYGLSWLLTKPAPAFPADAPLKHSARLRFQALLDDGSELEVRAELDITPLTPGDAAVNGRRTEQRIERRPAELSLVLDANAWLTRIKLVELSALDADGDGRVTLTSDTQAYEAILQGMTARFPPRLEWGAPSTDK